MLCNIYMREPHERLKMLGINVEGSPRFFINLHEAHVEQLKAVMVEGEFEIYPVAQDPHLQNLAETWVNGGIQPAKIIEVVKTVELPPQVITKTEVKEVIKEVFVDRPVEEPEVVAEEVIEDVVVEAEEVIEDVAVEAEEVTPVEFDVLPGMDEEAIEEKVETIEEALGVDLEEIPSEEVTEEAEEVAEEVEVPVAVNRKKNPRPQATKDDVPEGEILIDTKISFDKWKQDPKNITPKNKKEDDEFVPINPEDVPTDLREIEEEVPVTEVFEDEVLEELTPEELAELEAEMAV